MEGINPRDPSQQLGRTRANRLTFFPSRRADDSLIQPGDLVNVHIEEVRAFSLSGTLA